MIAAQGKVFVIPLGRPQETDAVLWRAAADPVDAGWTALELAPVEPTAMHGYAGTDGRYIYVIPNEGRGSTTPSGAVVRLDTATLPGMNPAVFDLATSLNGMARGFSDAVFDGRYMYILPQANGAESGIVVRYDTRAGFGDAGSWDFKDVRAMDPSFRQMGCGTFDGRYVYFFSDDDGTSRATMARYEVGRPFNSPAAWTFLSLAELLAPDAGVVVDYFAGAAFDGKYVYALGNKTGSLPNTLPLVLPKTVYVARIDTTVALSLAAVKIARFPDVLGLTPPAPAVLFNGMTFDGAFLYLGPRLGGVVARFEARSPRAPLTVGGGSVF